MPSRAHLLGQRQAAASRLISVRGAWFLTANHERVKGDVWEWDSAGGIAY